MASTRVRGTGATGTSTTPQVTLAANPAVGDLLIAYVKNNNTTQAAANGFTKLTEATATNITTYRGAIYWKIADSTDAASATVQPATLGTSLAWGCFVDQWTNPLGWPANPVNIESAKSSIASATSYTTDSVAPSADVDNVIAAGYGVTNATRTWSAEAFSGSNVGTVTEVGDTQGATLATAAISTVTGSYQGSATVSVAGTGLDNIAIFKPNAAVTAPPPPFQRRVIRLPA